MRRIKADTIANASKTVKRAWTAAQRQNEELADYGEFVQACGGPFAGRATTLQLAWKETQYAGRYDTTTKAVPVGIYHIRAPGLVYESVRYLWKVTPAAAPVAFPRTRVNNCTQPQLPLFGSQGKNYRSTSEILENNRLWAYENSIEPLPPDELRAVFERYASDHGGRTAAGMVSLRRG
jgi:hypothetical protein